MLEKLDLSRKLSKAQYKLRLPALHERLYQLQKACWTARIPSILAFEGWDTAGKGTTIAALTQPLEPRGFRLHHIVAPRTFETQLPWLWRFWQKIPNYGEMAIFDRSWYGRVLVERLEKLVPKAEWQRAFRDIVSLERTLADDGYVIIKFFLHISKKEQAKRLKSLEKDPLTAWHVEREDWERNRRYDEHLEAIEEMLEHTETEWGPWTLVESTDRRWRRTRVFETVIERLENALTRRGIPLPERKAVERGARKSPAVRRGARK